MPYPSLKSEVPRIRPAGQIRHAIQLLLARIKVWKSSCISYMYICSVGCPSCPMMTVFSSIYAHEGGSSIQNWKRRVLSSVDMSNPSLL